MKHLLIGLQWAAAEGTLAPLCPGNFHTMRSIYKTLSPRIAPWHNGHGRRLTIEMSQVQIHILDGFHYFSPHYGTLIDSAKADDRMQTNVISIKLFQTNQNQ